MPPTIKPGTLIKETLTLQQDLLNGLKISDLDRWIGDSDERQMVLRNMIFGRIRWPKSVGRPQSAALNQGFTILHWNTAFQIGDEGGVIVETTNTTLLPEPFKFDEPDDSDHYSVGFSAQVHLLYPQRIQPTFSGSVAWPHVRDSYRSIEPFDWSGSAINQLVIIPDFTVSRQLW